MKLIRPVNLILAVLVFAVMIPQYGVFQALSLAALVLVILVGYDRLTRRLLAARRERDRDKDSDRTR
jgi:hypothetical protein